MRTSYGSDMYEANQYLRKRAEQVAVACLAHLFPRAILLTSSVAEEESNEHSDIDLIVYLNELPSPEQMQMLREQIGIEHFRALGRDPGSFGEEYDLFGVECQVGYTRISHWEQELNSVLEQFDTETPMQKAIDSLLRGVPLYGADLIARWQARAKVYPEGLARAMVQANLKFFPLWRVYNWVAARDMRLFFYETLVKSSYNILSILARLNHLYFSSFHFKSQRQLIERMKIAPDNLAGRFEGLFHAEPEEAVSELERLVSQTVTLVEAYMPEIDTTRVLGDLGGRRTTWKVVPD